MAAVFRPAVAGDIPAILRIMAAARQLMAASGNVQWDAGYPAREHIEADIAAGIGYVLHDGEALLAYGAIDFGGEAAYEHLEGQWLSRQPYVVLHRLAAAARGRGLGRQFLAQTERLARQRGVKSFKIDTGRDNGAMRHILAGCGFICCGIVRYRGAKLLAFEKLLTD